MKLKNGIILIVMMLTAMLWGCGSDPKGDAKITGVSLESTSTTVNVGDAVTLPQFATAKWSDGKETSIGVVWDTTTVDTSIEGSNKSYTGTVTGWDGKLIYTVNVAKGEIKKYIQSVKLITTTATVRENAAFNLPSKAIATWSTGEETEAAITWDKAVDTSKAGTYIFEGAVDGYNAEKVKFTLIVKKEEIVNKIEKVYLTVSSNKVAQNSTFALPAQGIAVWTTGEETPIALTWDKAVSTATLGTTVYTAKATGTTYEVQYVLTVEKGNDTKVIPKALEFKEYSTITVTEKTLFTLPVYGTVTMSDDTKKTVTLTWDKTASTLVVGTFNYTASYEESGAKVTKVFTLNVTKEDEKPTISSLSLPLSEVTIKKGSVYVLPTSATATWTDGSKTEVALTWNGTVNTAEEGEYVFTGSTTGTIKTVILKVKVIKEEVKPTITALNLTTNTSTVKKGTSFTLPAEATATWTDGNKTQVTITWDKAASTSAEGIYTFIGSNISAPTIKVVYVLIVTAIIPEEATLQGLVLVSTTGTVEAKKTFALPTTGIAIYSDNTSKSVAVTWDKVTDTSKAGVFTYTASYTEGTVTKTAVFTLTVTPEPTEAKATKIAFTTNKITLQVKANGVYELPKTVPATYDNGTTKEVTITNWSPSATASIGAVGTTSYVAIFSEKYNDGTSVLLTAVYTVEVTKEIPETVLNVITLTKTSDTVSKGTGYTLSPTATAGYNDGTTKTVSVVWDKAVTTTAAGTTVYTASYTENGTTKTATFSLTVTEDILKATSFKISTTEATVVKGSLYSLPSIGTVTYNNGTTESVSVLWDKSVNTANTGLYTFTGTNTKAGNLTVTFKLTVADGTTPVLTLSDISEVKAGETFEVAVNASFFAVNVAAVDVRLVYDKTMLQGLDDATSMLSGMKIVKHIDGEQDVSVVLDKAQVISGTIFKVKFKALKDGKTSIKIGSKTQLLGTAGDKLTLETTDTAEISIGTGIIIDYSKLEISDATGNTNGETEVTISATGFTETSLGFDIVLNYDTAYLDIARDGNGNASSSIVTLLNDNFWSNLIIAKEVSAGKLMLSIITNKTTPITLNGDLFKVKFKTKSLSTTGTTVSFGEVKIANSIQGYQTSVTTTDTGKVVINKVESKSSFEIGDATGSYPGYVNVKLSGTGFTETASGLEFIVNYDAGYLEIENLTNDVTLTGALAGGTKIVSLPSAGKVKIAIVIYNETFTANGELVNIKFKTKKAGSTTLSYSNVDLGNAAATGKITASTTDTGTVTLNQVVSVATTVELSASSTSFTAGGSSTLTAVVKDQNGNVMSSETADIYNGTTKAGSNTYSFSSSTEGTYTFTAKSGALTSTAVTVTVNKAGEVVTGGPYATNGVGVGKNKTITIDGAISDWSDDMLIAQGAAWDIANKWKGGHENCVLDSYSMYAAWDDTNLYIAWQMVNTTDTWANPGDGPLSDGGRVLDVALGIAIDTGKKTAMTGKVEDGKYLWGVSVDYKTKVDHLLYMSGKVGLGKPTMYTAVDATGAASYLETKCQAFAKAGIKYAMAMDSLPKQIMMLDGTSVLPKDVTSSTATWVDAMTKNHSRKYDSFYEMSIPLEVLGIDRAYLESNGIGAMQISTRGMSAIDTMPHDATTLDNVMGDCAVDPSTSHEKDDIDSITVPLARIGKK